MYVTLEENIPFLTQAELSDDELFKNMPEFSEFWNSEEGRKSRSGFANILEKLYLESNIEPYIDIEMVNNLKAQYSKNGDVDSEIIEYIFYFIKFKDYIQNRKIYMQAFLSYSKFYDNVEEKITALEELKEILFKNVAKETAESSVAVKIKEFYSKWKKDMILEIIDGTRKYILGKSEIYEE